MPKFHFEIVDGYRIEDPYGMELPTATHARVLAEQIAEQIARDIEDGSLEAVVVKTNSGVEIYKAPIPKAP